MLVYKEQTFIHYYVIMNKGLLKIALSMVICSLVPRPRPAFRRLK